MAEQGIDEEKLRTLGGWAAGLRTDARAEVAAAGRAIEMLVEEIERLHVLVWEMRLYPEADTDARETGAATVAEREESFDQTLRERLAFPWRRSEHPQS